MNAFFGSVSTNQKLSRQSANTFSKYCREKLKVKCVSKSLSSKFNITHTVTNGILLGTAASDDIMVLFYGFLYPPIKSWDEKISPMEDPSLTALYLLKQYIKKGDQFIDNIHGHYSIVLYDGKNDKLILTKDPDGQNDIFIYSEGDKIFFSNKLLALKTATKKNILIDRSFEDFLLIYGFYPYLNTAYKNIYSVPKGQTLIFKDGEKTYHPIKSSSKIPNVQLSDEKAVINELYKSLFNATKDIVPKDTKRVAVLLGGFDSALVASLLKKQGKEVETFSFYYKEKSYNQAHTDTLSKHLGIKHNWIKVDEKIFKSMLDNFTDIFNYPTNWPSYVMQTAYLSKVISERGFKYCYSGDGCDSLFYGFPLTFKRAEIMSKLGSLPTTILKVMSYITEMRLLELSLGRPQQVLVGALRSARREYSIRTFLTFRIFNESSLKNLRKGAHPKQQEDTEETVKNLSESFKGISSVRMAYEGKNMVAPSRNKLNGSADLSGIVIMSPYTHHLVKAFVKKIPDKLLRPDNADTPIGKYILSKMAERKKLLPVDIIYQPKMAASDSPLTEWYNAKLNRAIYKYLKDLPFEYDSKYTSSLIRDKISERFYSKIMSKETNNIMSLAHCISLLLTYSRFTKGKNE